MIVVYHRRDGNGLQSAVQIADTAAALNTLIGEPGQSGQNVVDFIVAPPYSAVTVAGPNPLPVSITGPSPLPVHETP